MYVCKSMMKEKIGETFKVRSTIHPRIPFFFYVHKLVSQLGFVCTSEYTVCTVCSIRIESHSENMNIEKLEWKTWIHCLCIVYPCL